MDNIVATNRSSGGAKSFLLGVTKGVFASLCVSLIGILIFAVVLKFFDMSDLTIKIVNQVIKVISVAVGVIVSLKGDKQKGILKGLLVGLLYTVLSYLVFSLLVANFEFSKTIIFDSLFLTLAGIIFGVVFVNIKK